LQVYWYWPFIRDELLALARAFPESADEGALGRYAERPRATKPDHERDQLIVHAMPGRLTGLDTSSPGWRVEATLPPVASREEGTLRWAMSRATTYGRQVRARRKRLSAEHFDVAHVWFLNYLVDAFDLRSLRSRVPLVVTVHDVVPHQKRMPRPVEHALLAKQYAAASTIVVHHRSVREQLIAEFGVAPARIHDVPHWVIPAPAAPRDTPTSQPTILFFGALRRNKGVDVLLEAFRTMTDPDLRLVVAGRGAADVEAEVRTAAARDSRITAEIDFVPEARKHALFRAADLVVLPYTQFSSQSGVLHDAYAHHRPVVVSDVGALGASVRDDASGWVVPPGDAAALAQEIEHSFSDPQVWRDRAANAGAVGHDRSPLLTARRLRAVYASVAHEPRQSHQ
jgi:glycosyltransferase involved in cell wall biosynthesis